MSNKNLGGSEIPDCHEPGQMRCNVCGMLPIKPKRFTLDARIRDLQAEVERLRKP